MYLVPHGRVYLALAQLAQQAHTRDVQGDDVPIVCPPNIFSEATEAHGRLLDRALLGKPNSTLGWSRRTHAQERHLKYFGLVDDGGKAISFTE